MTNINTVVGLQNISNQALAKKTAENGASQELGTDTFLRLMLEQLQNQDPLNPMDNSQFLQQQAMFTQVESLQNIQKELSVSAQVSQACNLIGKNVIIEANNTYYSGVVDAVNFNESGASVIVGENEYPLSSVIQATMPETENTTNSETNNDENS